MKSAEHWHDEGVTNIASTLHRVEARLKDAELPTLEHVQAIYAIYREKARVESAESELAVLKAELEKVAHVIEPHWKGAGAKLESEWMIKEIVGHGRIIDDLDEEVSKLKAERFEFLEKLANASDREVALINDNAALKAGLERLRALRDSIERFVPIAESRNAELEQLKSSVRDFMTVLPSETPHEALQDVMATFKMLLQNRDALKLKLEVAKKTLEKFTAQTELSGNPVWGLEVSYMAREALSQLNESEEKK